MFVSWITICRRWSSPNIDLFYLLTYFVPIYCFKRNLTLLLRRNTTEHAPTAQPLFSQGFQKSTNLSSSLFDGFTRNFNKYGLEFGHIYVGNVGKKITKPIGDGCCEDFERSRGSHDLLLNFRPIAFPTSLTVFYMLFL